MPKIVCVAVAVFTLSIFFVNGQTPVANFTANNLAGCSPLIVQFQDLSSGNPTSWSWDFGSGNTSSNQNPTATYFIPGNYTVTLTVKNANGSNTLVRSQYITVYETPTINFSASQTTGCFPLHVQFTDNSNPGAGNTNTGWFWDFGDGAVSTEQNPLHTYTSAGSFTITLKVTNDKGCYRVTTTPNYITTNPGITGGFTNTLPAVCQPPADVSFTNTSAGPGTLTYQWDFGDGAVSTDQNPLHTYTTTGLYSVKLIVNNDNGCTDTVTKNNLIPVGQYNPSFTNPGGVCINIPASFINTSQPVPSSQVWDFGDGTTSNQPNPVKTYTTAGTYTVKLITNYGTCSDSVSNTINVLDKPAAAFTAANAVSCKPPLDVNFQDQSINATAWQWRFGDGATSDQQNPAHTYTDYGSYNVTLIVTNASGCIDSVTKTAFVKIIKPQISIPSLPIAGCIPFTINPVAVITIGDAVTSYLWDFGDGNTSASATPVHTYPVQGTYTVRLIITTSTGCTDTLLINNAVRVGSQPTADFSATPIPVCASDPVLFTDLSTTADAWLWNFGDGTTSSAQNPSHTYLQPGIYTITLTVTNNGCPASATKTNYITVRPPVAAFIAVPNCANRLQFSFLDQSLGPVTTWLWDFGDGATSNLQNPVHDFPALGVYNVTLTATTVFGPGDQCSYSIAKTIYSIDENPDFTVNTNPACKGSPVTFTTTVGHPSYIAAYQWDFGDGTTTATNTLAINHIYTNSGTYSVQLITRDINGCRDTMTKPNFIRVNGPRANFSATNSAGCKGLNVTFNDLSTTDGVNAITNWRWDFGDGTIQNYTGGPFQHVYLNEGTYSVKLKTTDASGCSDSLTIPNLVIATDPVPGFTSLDTLSCPGATVNFNNTSVAVNYTSAWDFGDGNTSAVASPGHIYTATGFYTVKLRITDQYGCPDSITKNTFVKIDSPVAGFTLDDSISSCTPFQVKFKNSSTYFASVLWKFGDAGISTFPDSVVHYYGLPGTFQVSLIATSPGGCRDTAYKTVTVYDTAGSFINYTPLGGCSPQSVSFTAFTPGQVTYLWDFGDGNTDSTSIPATGHVYTSFGDYVPRVIMKDPSGCLVPISGINTIHVTGSITKFGLDKNLICDSGSVNFIDSTTFNDPITNWNWDFGDGGTSTAQNPTHLYSSPGIYTVSLNTLTTAGCRDTATLTNIVKVVLSPLIAITGDSAACIFNTMTQQGIFLRNDTSAVTWSWNFPNGNLSALQNPPPQSYTTAGNFTVTAIATNSDGCTDTEVKNIVVNPLPVIDMPGTVTLMVGTSLTIPATYSPNAATWQWSPQAGLSCTSCPQPEATPKFNTTYHVLVIDSNGCRNTGAINIIVVCKDGNIFIPNTFSPNGDGSNDKFYPRGKGIDRVQVLRIFNRWGEVVFEKINFPVNDSGYGWDGTFKGKGPQPDVYVYQVEVYCTNGELIKFTGNVALIL
ncbi:MAG: PKD domain-containing protein [Bacteroidota bacterium]